MEGRGNARFDQTANVAITAAAMAVNRVQVAEVLSSCSKVAKEERSRLGEPDRPEGKYSLVVRLGKPENYVHRFLVLAGFNLEIKGDSGQ